jgi:hypothetical protein
MDANTEKVIYLRPFALTAPGVGACMANSTAVVADPRASLPMWGRRIADMGTFIAVTTGPRKYPVEAIKIGVNEVYFIVVMTNLQSSTEIIGSGWSRV